MTYFPPLRWVTKTLHLSPTALAHFHILELNDVKHFAQHWSRPLSDSQWVLTE